MQVLEDIIVVDDCINPVYQNALEDMILNDRTFYWNYYPNLVVKDRYSLAAGQIQSDAVGFAHVWTQDYKACSSCAGFMTPLLYEASVKANIKINKIIQARCFMQIPTIKTTEWDGMHVDLVSIPHNVCLYYVNDSDGDTFISNKRQSNIKPTGFPIIKRITPKKGRCVFFNGEHYHSSSKPTQNERAVININFN